MTDNDDIQQQNVNDVARGIAPCWQPQCAGLCQCPMCVIRPKIADALRSYGEAEYKRGSEDQFRGDKEAFDQREKQADAEGYRRGYRAALRHTKARQRGDKQGGGK